MRIYLALPSKTKKHVSSRDITGACGGGISEALNMAHLRKQGRFVEQLYGSGMVDESEKEALIEPIERLERRLMRRGGLGWRSPRVDEVLCRRTAAPILTA